MKSTTQLLLPEYYEYRKFLAECQNKSYDDSLVLHKHHIIPKHLGGGDDVTNLVLLSVEDHARCHILLSRCFDANSYESVSNLRSSRILDSKSIRDKNDMDAIANSQRGELNPFFGKKHSDETRRYLSECTKKHRMGVSYDELYNEHADEQKITRQKSMQQYWDNVDPANKQERVQKTRSAVLRQDPAIRSERARKAANSKYPKISIDGVVFDSFADACLHFNTTRFLLKKQYSIEVIK